MKGERSASFKRSAIFMIVALALVFSSTNAFSEDFAVDASGNPGAGVENTATALSGTCIESEGDETVDRCEWFIENLTLPSSTYCAFTNEQASGPDDYTKTATADLTCDPGDSEWNDYGSPIMYNLFLEGETSGGTVERSSSFSFSLSREFLPTLTVDASGNPSSGSEKQIIPLTGTCSDTAEDIDSCDWEIEYKNYSHYSNTYCTFSNETMTGPDDSKTATADLFCSPPWWFFTWIESPIEYIIKLRGENDEGDIEYDSFYFTLNENSEPIADAGPDIYTFSGTSFNFDGTGSTDAEDCPTGGDCSPAIEYNWYQKVPGPDPLIATGPTPSYNFATAGAYDVTLEVIDSFGEDDEDKYVRVYVQDSYTCDFSDYLAPFGPGNYDSVLAFALDFAGRISADSGTIDFDATTEADPQELTFYMNEAADNPNIKVYTDFLVGGWSEDAILRVDVYDLTEGLYPSPDPTAIRESFNNWGGSSADSELTIGISDLLADFGEMDPTARDRHYRLDFFYIPCSGSLSGTDPDDAYDNDYIDTYNPADFVPLNLSIDLQIGAEARGHAWVCQRFNDVLYSEDVSQLETDSDHGFVTIIGNEYWLSNISNFHRICNDGAESNSQVIMRVILTNVDGSTDIFYNCNEPADWSVPGATFTSCQNNIQVPLNSIDILELKVQRKSCDLYKNYYTSNAEGSWSDLTRADSSTVLYDNVLVFDPDHMRASVTGTADPVYFGSDPTELKSFDIHWTIKNTSIDSRIDLKLNKDSPPFVASTLYGSEGAVFTGPGLPDGVTIEYDDETIYTETVSGAEFRWVLAPESNAGQGALKLASEEKKANALTPAGMDPAVLQFAGMDPVTLTYTVEIPFIDKWGLVPSPPNSPAIGSVDVTFLPPPGEILRVTDIEVFDPTTFPPTPTSSLNKDTALFDVEVTVENLSKAFILANIELVFYDAVTNEKLVLESQTISDQVLPIGAESENSINFNGILLKTEPKFVPGRNYWVKAEITNTGTEVIIINNEKKTGFSIIGAERDVPVPEITPLLVVAIAFAALFFIWKKR